MNIGFDLDKVFINYPPFIPEKLVDWLYKKHNHVLAYRYPSKIEQAIRRLSHNTVFRRPIKENVAFLTELARTNSHKRYLISGRFGFLENITKNLLKRHHLSELFCGFEFNFKNKQPHIFKDEAIKKFKIDIYIDDDLPLLEFLARRNPNVKFFWLTKNPQKNSQKNIKSIRRLEEIFSK